MAPGGRCQETAPVCGEARAQEGGSRAQDGYNLPSTGAPPKEVGQEKSCLMWFKQLAGERGFEQSSRTLSPIQIPFIFICL